MIAGRGAAVAGDPADLRLQGAPLPGLARRLRRRRWRSAGRAAGAGLSGARLPHPQRLREQLEGVIWRFRTGSQWREMPEEFGAWQTVYDRFTQWRYAGVLAALMDGMIAEAAQRGQADLSLVSVDSTVARAHHDAAAGRAGAGTRGGAGRASTNPAPAPPPADGGSAGALARRADLQGPSLDAARAGGPRLHHGVSWAGGDLLAKADRSWVIVGWPLRLYSYTS